MSLKSLFIFLIFIGLGLVLFFRQKDILVKQEIPKTDAKIILELYQMMKDVHELFVKNNITYFIDGGTLLGAIRHRGIIPWDDDLDIVVDKSLDYEIKKLELQLNLIGYGLVEFWFGFKIFPLTGKPVEDTNFKFPFLDIFLSEKNGDKICYVNRNGGKFDWGKRDGENIYHKFSETFPLKKYQFGKIFLYGSKNPENYLAALYGDNWKSHAHVFNHSQVFNGPKNFNLLEPQEFCAQPIGPLVDKIK